MAGRTINENHAGGTHGPPSLLVRCRAPPNPIEETFLLTSVHFFGGSMNSASASASWADKQDVNSQEYTRVYKLEVLLDNLSTFDKNKN